MSGAWSYGNLNPDWDDWGVRFDGLGHYTTIYVGDPASSAPVAVVTQAGLDCDSECEARACLLSAAPELVKALTAVYLYFERMDPLDLADVDVGLPEMVSAALAKARGEG